MITRRHLVGAACSALTALALLPAAAPAETGDITTVAGGGASLLDGDPATDAQLFNPVAVVPTADGGFLISEEGIGVVRKVLGGAIATIAGTGANGAYNGDDISATTATLNHPQGIAVLPDGSFLIADSANNRVRRVSGATITTVAGTGVAGYNADDIVATDALIGAPFGLAPATGGGFLIAESSGARIRKVFPNGLIETVGGTGTSGLGADGSALFSDLDNPFDVAAAPDHSVLVAESSGNRVRRISGGVVGTVAGRADGSGGYNGDNAPATEAKLDAPHGVAAAPDGSFLVADSGNDRIRRISPDGRITTVAGNGISGYDAGDDGGPATLAELDNPTRIAIDPQGGLYIADSGNERIRHVEGPARPVLRGVHPASPANQNRPRIRGTAPAGATVYLFRGAGCPDLPISSGPSAAFTGGGVAAPVPNDTTTDFSAIVEQDGVDSACSTTTVNYIEDSQPPNTRIGAGPRHSTSDRTPTFSFGSIPAGQARFRCALGGAVLRRCPARKTFGPLALGRHVVRVIAIDVAGNADRTPAARRFRITR